MILATSLIASFGSSATVTRKAAGSYVNHAYIAGATTTFTITICIQPLTEDELVNLPEAQRTRKQMKGYTVTELFTAEISDAKIADCVTFESIEYEVQGAEKWQGDLSHWKVRLVEKGE